MYLSCSSMLLCITSSLLLLATASHAANTFISLRQAQQAQQSSISLDGVKQLTLVFRMKDLSQAPTPPQPYKSMPLWRWDWAGGDGYLLVTRNDFGPAGVLTEMMYFPGRFRPTCSNTKFFSAQRFWVDMKISMQIGRTYWGFPKEMAAFEWTANSVTAKDLQGRVFFKASLAAAETTRTQPPWISTIIQRGFSTLQWPIKDARINIANVLNLDIRVTATEEEAAEAAAEAAVAARLLHGTNVTAAAASITQAADAADSAVLVPNRQKLTFPKYDSLTHVKATDIWFDSFAFTGRQNMSVAAVGAPDVAYIEGSPGELDHPKPFTCRQGLH